MKIKPILTGMVITTALLFAACVSAGPAIEDITWVLESYGEPENLQAVVENTEVTAFFDSAKSQVTGSGGCNHYFAGYEISKNKISVPGPIGATEMACLEPGVMEQEQEYFSLLNNAESFKLKNGKLIISCSRNQILVFVAR